MRAIVNTKLILEDGIVWDGAVTFDQGRIVAAGERDEVAIPADAGIIDAGGLYTAPGFVDIHVHGSEHYSFRRDPPLRVAEEFLCHGQTTLLPTFFSDLLPEQMIERVQACREAAGQGVGRVLDGIYMEGPYMAGFSGNQNSIQQMWMDDIRREDYVPLVDAIGDMVRVWAIDPARPGIGDFMACAKEKNPQVLFALGHSRATAAQCRGLRDYGLRVQTHHGDSGKAPGHAQGTVGAGCDEYTLYDPDMYAELICDEKGVHVDPDLIKLVIRTKGVERVVLITDSEVAYTDPATGKPYTNNPADGVAYGPDLNYDYEGHVSGSHLTLDRACRNVMKHTGYGLCHAVRFASLNPARLLGLDREIGSIAAGKRANLILMDDTVRVRRVFLDGELVCEDGKLAL